MRERLTSGAELKVRGTQRYLQVPILLGVGLILVLELLAYFVLRLIFHLFEWSLLIIRPSKLTRLHGELAQATDYRQWSEIAAQIDQQEGRTSNKNYAKWQRSKLQKLKSFAETTQRLRLAISANDVAQLKRILTAEVFHSGQPLGIDNEMYYSSFHSATFSEISEYEEVVKDAIQMLSNSDQLPIEDKNFLLSYARDSIGETALCLSGGVTMAFYHFGVIRALLDSDALPRVITGTSGGSMVASWIGCRTDEELREVLNPDVHQYLLAFNEGWPKLIWRMLTEGVLLSQQVMMRLTEVATLGHTTFLEAHQRCGRVLNITVTSHGRHGKPITLNYITAPNVLIHSAVVASATLPGVMHPARLLAKSKTGEIYDYQQLGECWADGSLHIDIPREDISKLFNVKFFIVSQTNPHVLPFIFQNSGSAGEPALAEYSGGLRGGLLFNFLELLLKMDMKKWLQLLYAMDLTPSVGGIDMRKVWLQRFFGTVTVCPKLDWTLLWGYMMLFADPSRKDMEVYFAYGKRLTYPKLSMILRRTRVQRALEASCFQKHR